MFLSDFLLRSLLRHCNISTPSHHLLPPSQLLPPPFSSHFPSQLPPPPSRLSPPTSPLPHPPSHLPPPNSPFPSSNVHAIDLFWNHVLIILIHSFVFTVDNAFIVNEDFFTLYRSNTLESRDVAQYNNIHLFNFPLIIMLYHRVDLLNSHALI